MKNIFSGVQPSGVIHLGNYLGAIKQWVNFQDAADQAIFCIVDLHSITIPQDPVKLQQNIYSIAALYLAAGIDPKKSALFVQSSRPEHSELAWILNCFTNIGELSRMTQFKEKSELEKSDKAGVGLFDYPVLMAADILLYNTTHVPVGDDQKQHLELTRDLALRINNKFGEIFTVPEAVINKTSSRIMGLDNPLKKMSKSASSPNNYIAMTDKPDVVREKIKRAVTDSGSEIIASSDKPAMTNLLNIFSEVTMAPIDQIESKYKGRGYGEFKADLAEAIITFLEPIQKRYYNYLENQSELKSILSEGAEKIKPLAQGNLAKIKKAVGLGL